MSTQQPVSIHAPARGATPSTTARPSCWWSFNPRARTGRDGVSVLSHLRCLLFQSTRPHGARRWWCLLPAQARRFNPRARTGRDITSPSSARYTSVSIHAPARGATAHRYRSSSGRCCFNPRARTGRDLPSWAGKPCKATFQSTRPHGARPAAGDIPERDVQVSIHAPARGATRGASRLLRGCCCFNPRARTGRDAAKLLDRGQHAGVSIHAPARGATTATSSQTRCFRKRFNPRARTGRDARRAMTRFALGCFNPRARTGRDVVRLRHRPQGPGFNPRARTGRDSVILPTRISTPIVGPIAIPSHDLLISPITPIQVRKFLMITRCWRRANRQRKTRSLQVRGSKNQGTL